RSHGQEATREETSGQRLPWHGETMRLFLLPCVATGVSLLAVWCLIGATPRGQPWTSAVTLPQGRNELSARWRAEFYTSRYLSLARPEPHELLRSSVLGLTL